MDLSPQMLREIPQTVSYHWKEGNLNWIMIIYISLVHIVAIAGAFAIPQASNETLIFAFLLWPLRYVAIQQLESVAFYLLLTCFFCVVVSG